MDDAEKSRIIGIIIIFCCIIFIVGVFIFILFSTKTPSATINLTDEYFKHPYEVPLDFLNTLSCKELSDWHLKCVTERNQYVGMTNCNTLYVPIYVTKCVVIRNE